MIIKIDILQMKKSSIYLKNNNFKYAIHYVKYTNIYMHSNKSLRNIIKILFKISYQIYHIILYD